MRNDKLEEEEDILPSKSETKRQMLALQKLGEALVLLNDKQLAQVPVEDIRLSQAIREARQIRSNSARRRHLQFIGKLMRHIDPEPIQNALQGMDQRRQLEADAFHELERMRDDILHAGAAGAELAVQRWPQADRQQLRQFVLQHQREVQKGRATAASRKLFRYLRELQERYGDD